MQAQASGSFLGSVVDLRDGYIHFSSRHQVSETARKHFTGQSGLMLLAISASALGDQLKWEPSRGGQLFPHLYAALPASAVVRAKALTYNPEGDVDLM